MDESVLNDKMIWSVDLGVCVCVWAGGLQETTGN